MEKKWYTRKLSRGKWFGILNLKNIKVRLFFIIGLIRKWSERLIRNLNFLIKINAKSEKNSDQSENWITSKFQNVILHSTVFHYTAIYIYTYIYITTLEMQKVNNIFKLLVFSFFFFNLKASFIILDCSEITRHVTSVLPTVNFQFLLAILKT